jgi:hypothetical protein
MTKIKIFTNVNIEKLELAVNTWLNENRNDINVVSTQFIDKISGQPVRPGVMITYTT